MLKAVKECMKNWLLVHERLYWYIVIGLAVLAFGIVTAVGCAKVYDANAADITDYHANRDYVGYYETACEYMTSRYGADFVANRPYRVVVGGWGEQNTLCFVFFSEIPMDFGNLSVWHEAFFPATYCVYVYYDTNKVEFSNRDCVYCDARSIRYTTYDIAYGDGLVIEATKPVVYSGDAPYVTFERLDVINKLAQGTAVLGHIDNLYKEYFVSSTWTYNGKLNDMHETDSGYVLNVKFDVELPTIEYVRELYNEFGYDADIGRIVLRRNKELVDYWNKDLKAESRTFTVEYSMELSPDDDGVFSYTFTFVEWEYLLRTVSDELVSEFGTYDSYWRSILLSFMHIKKVTSEVLATRSDSIVYGGYTTDLFERGIYDSCAEAVTGVDKNFVSSDLLEDLINDDLRVAEREHLKELEDKINSLEGQVGSMSSINGAFTGDLNGSDLWSGFVGLVSGLGSIAPAIQSLSLLSGVVFGFLPVQMAGIISTTVFAICVVAIIKALRG